MECCVLLLHCMLVYAHVMVVALGRVGWCSFRPLFFEISGHVLACVCRVRRGSM